MHHSNAPSSVEQRLESLLPLLACPECLAPFDPGPQRPLTRLVCMQCKGHFKIRDGRPYLVPGAEAAHDPAHPVTEAPAVDYPPKVLDFLDGEREGWVLDCGAGFNVSRCQDRIVRFDVFAYPTVDVVGLAESLPFRDECFAGVISLAVLEHVSDPYRAVREMHRVLKPSGRVIVDAPFLAPVHRFPHHYFNVTPHGLVTLFSDFEKLDAGVEPYQHPEQTLRWMLEDLFRGMTSEDEASRLREMTLGEALAMLKELPDGQPFRAIKPETVEQLACGSYFSGRKPRSSGPRTASSRDRRETMARAGEQQAFHLMEKRLWWEQSRVRCLGACLEQIAKKGAIDVSAPVMGHVDAPVDGGVLPEGASICGWAHSPFGIRHVLISIDGATPVAARIGHYRPDVKAAYPDCPGIEHSGWFLEEPLRLSPGVHQIEIRTSDFAGRGAELGHFTFTAAQSRTGALWGSASRSPGGQNADIDPEPAIIQQFLAGQGLEIGPLHNPIRLPHKAKVFRVDRLGRDDLLTHYPELDPADIAEPDVICEADDLEGFEDDALDFVAARHVFEHLCDPIGTLAEWWRVLKAGGVVYLLVPDRSHSFDRHRATTSLYHLVEDFANHSRRIDLDHYREWVEKVEHVPDPEDREKRIRQLYDMRYSIHPHVFDADSMAGLVSWMGQHLGKPWKVARFLNYSSGIYLVLEKRSGSDEGGA